MNEIIKIIAFLTALFLLIGSIMNSDSLLTGRKERTLTKLIGRTGVRIFYGISGVIVICILLLDFLNVLKVDIF